LFKAKKGGVAKYNIRKCSHSKWKHEVYDHLAWINIEGQHSLFEELLDAERKPIPKGQQKVVKCSAE